LQIFAIVATASGHGNFDIFIAPVRIFVSATRIQKQTLGGCIPKDPPITTN
jgi:hypothetical protein